MGTPANIIVGSHVWAEDPVEAWIDGEVKDIKGKRATIFTTNGKTIVADISSIYPKDTEAPSAGVDDMTKLAYLHEPGVLYNLACRFALNEIYTYTGNILIAVNPFQRLPHLYDIHMMKQYKGAAFGELNPHLFAIADTSYRAMINEAKSQSILVSGESGAGKTETTKMLMRYLAFMGGRSGTEGRTVEQQVLESNPVLEAFGNSKTVKNNNSSRFGKFVEIQFDKQGKISGAAIRTYLLERSRVCQVSDPERNYHCFYMLCAAPPEDVKKFKVGDPRTFRYLNQSSCYQVSNVDDAREYLETRNAMDIVGISQDEQDGIFRVVAAILHLGNVDFAKGKEADSSKLKDEKSHSHLQTAAELLMCDVKALEDSLTKRVIVTPDGNITKLLDPDAASQSRDALAKTVYSRLFDWIVDKINNSIGQDPNAISLIGVLDIYGFESFKINSFEQLCINLTNEKLQQHFNQHVFKMEQEDYTREEINWSYVEFVDNQDVLDLIEKKPGGIIALLDEACMFPKSTHETFAQKMYQTYRGHKRFRKPKLAQTAFTINHYAGDVTYQADHFLDKNKDYVIAEHQALLNASKCPFVASLIPPPPEESSKQQSKFSSIGTRFKQQLQALMETLSTTEPHYIRCVKPNTVLKPGIFENDSVLNQLRCSGVLEAIRISCAGYPTKRTFEDFLDRFAMLATDTVDGSDEKSACIAICERKGLKGYQIGKTKVFLRAGQMAELDAQRAEILANAANLIQRQIQSYLIRKEFIAQRRATINIQKLCRGQLARKLYEKMRMEAASTRIQKNVQAYKVWKFYKGLQASAKVIQTGLRAMAARNEYRHRRRTKAAIKIQTEYRRHQALSAYKQKKKATLMLQCLWRAKVAKKELRKLKMAARETGALKEAKDKLEKRVEELTWRLDFEKKLRVDLEEAKGQEIAKLKNGLSEIQVQLEEAHAAVIHEKEAAKLAIEQAPPVIKEVPVVDNTKLELLASQNEELEVDVERLKKKIEEFEELHSAVEKESQERLKEAEETKLKAMELQEMIERLESNVANLESENQVLRQQALVASQNEELSEELSILREKIANLESENESLKDQVVNALKDQVVNAEKIMPKEVLLPPVKDSESGHETEEFQTTKEVQSPREVQITKEEAQTTKEEVQITKEEEVQITKGNEVQIAKEEVQIAKEEVQIAKEEEIHITKEEIQITKEVQTTKEPGLPASILTKQRSQTDRQQENHELLIKCLVEEKRFEKDTSVAACTVYNVLLHWGSFEAEKTNIFDRIVHTIRSSIESQDNIADLAYWLSTISTLLFLLQDTLKVTGAVSKRSRASPNMLFGRMAKGYRSSSLSMGISSGYSGMVAKQNETPKVEAKYPALLFKQHLTAYVEKIYGMIRDSLKKEISPFLNLCIHAPRVGRPRTLRGLSKQIQSTIVAKQQASYIHWQNIIYKLEHTLSIMSENYVPSIITGKLFHQIFSYINVQLFNSLLLRRECCSFSNGEYLKTGLHELEQWSLKAADKLAGAESPSVELQHIKQAVGILVLRQKAQKTLDEITKELCPILSFPQVYRIGTMFYDDKYGTQGLSPEVLGRMRKLTEDSTDISDSSFLLDVDSCIPFTMEEMSQSFHKISLSDVNPPQLLRQKSDFHFLFQTIE